MSMLGKIYYNCDIEKSSKPKRKKEGFFRRINRRFPLLKLILVIVVGMMTILNLLDITVPSISDLKMGILGAPMGKHVKIVKRDLTGKKLVALTFDDGPSALTTPTLLDILRGRAVPSTFFMLGRMASYNPDIVRRANDEGHEVASHTMSHQNLVTLSSSEIEEEIDTANEVIEDILESKPECIRPPYGNIDEDVREKSEAPLVLWSVDSLDWQSRDSEEILRVVNEEVHDGAIILMHDIYDSTVEAVPLVVDSLREEGYEFVTVSELAKIRGVELEKGEMYYDFR